MADGKLSIPDALESRRSQWLQWFPSSPGRQSRSVEKIRQKRMIGFRLNRQYDRQSNSNSNPRLSLPLLQGLLPFGRVRIGPDIVAGITLAALGIPEVYGYTKIIGTPVITGLYQLIIYLNREEEPLDAGEFLKCRYPKLSLEATHGHRTLVWMLISEVSVRCTGHLLAISSSRELCSAVKGPSNRTSRSILSSIPSFISTF